MPNLNLPSRHLDFYIRGGDLHFQVDRSLFKIHSYFFLRESAYWRNRLLPGPNAREDEPFKEGSSSLHPITLDNVKSEEFSRFLWIIYNRKYGDYSKPKCGHWIEILRLAARWEFLDMKELAISHLEKFEIDIVKRIQLYQDYSVHEKYLFPLYIQLASREELIELDEARDLGLETLVFIQQARERLRVQDTNTGRDQSPSSPIRADLQQEDLVKIVASTFKIPLAKLNLPG